MAEQFIQFAEPGVRPAPDLQRQVTEQGEIPPGSFTRSGNRRTGHSPDHEEQR